MRTLFGRDQQLAMIDAALDEAAAGRGRLVMVAGEPGIGKTSLADAATARGAARGFRVLWGRCWEPGGAPAYWPWLDILDALARVVDDDESLARVLGDGASRIADLLPRVAARLPRAPAPATAPAEEARFRLWRAATALVRQAATEPRAPVVIVLDDLHAADRSSLQLLHFLARELRSLRVLLLCTYRDVEARVSAPVSASITEISREGTTLALPRLQPDVATALVREQAGDVPPAVTARIVDGAQGNPLFIEEMLRLLAERGAEAVARGGVPEGIRDVIGRRLSLVSASGRALLDLAAVTGDSIDGTLLGHASQAEAATVASGLAEATRAGVLVEDAGRHRFGHALFREVLVRELSEPARRALHGQLANALADRRAKGDGQVSDAELAHHALRGPIELLPRAVEHAVRAAARAQEVAAYEDAIGLLDRAREVVAAASDPPAPLVRLLLALAAARIRRGDAAAGQTAAREAAAIAEKLGDPELSAEAALIYGRVFTFGAVDPVLVDMLEQSLEALPPGDCALRARLLARLAAALQPSPTIDEPVRVAREAIATARRLGDRSVLLETLHDAISALMDIVDPAEQRRLNLEAESLAVELGDRERLLRTLGRLALAHLSLGELEAADARIEAFAALAHELKAPWIGWRAQALRSMRAAMHGRFDEAERLGDEALSLGRNAGDPAAERIWLTSREGLLRTAHRLEEMLAWESRARRARASFSNASFWQATGAALVHARREERDSARAHLELVAESSRWPVANLFALFFLIEPAALAGSPDLARELYERLQTVADEYVTLGMAFLSWEGPTSRLRGVLAASLGRWEAAWTHFEDAAARCRRLDVRPHLARAEYDHACARVRRGAAGDLERARALFESARSHARAMGMTGLDVLIQRRLAGLSDSQAPAPAHGGAPQPPEFSFTLEGELWSIAHADKSFRLRDSLGLRYLVRLFAEPGREIHVLDLVAERIGGSPAEALDLGDAGELLDDEAKESYRERLEDLRDEVAEAESFGHSERVARAQREIEALAGELQRAVGLGGRSRRAGAAAERARSAVRRRIKNALDRIGAHAPALAEHLASTVRTGTYCVFRPERR